MHPRQLLIVAGIAVVAFGAAFGIASASGGGDKAPASTPAAKTPAPAEVIEVGDATVSAKVRAAGALPSLKVPKKQPEPTTSTTTTAPSTGTTTPAPSTTTPAPSTSTTAPSTTTTTPAPSTTTPAPSSSGGGGGGGGGGVVIRNGGGED